MRTIKPQKKKKKIQIEKIKTSLPLTESHMVDFGYNVRDFSLIKRIYQNITRTRITDPLRIGVSFKNR